MPAWALTNGVCMSIIKRQPSGDCGAKRVLRLAELAYWSEKPEAKAPQKSQEFLLLYRFQAVGGTDLMVYILSKEELTQPKKGQCPGDSWILKLRPSPKNKFATCSLCLNVRVDLQQLQAENCHDDCIRSSERLECIHLGQVPGRFPAFGCYRGYLLSGLEFRDRLLSSLFAR